MYSHMSKPQQTVENTLEYVKIVNQIKRIEKPQQNKNIN